MMASPPPNAEESEERVHSQTSYMDGEDPLPGAAPIWSLDELERRRVEIRRRIESWTAAYTKAHGLPPTHHDKRRELRKDYDDYLRVSKLIKVAKHKRSASVNSGVAQLNAKVHQVLHGLDAADEPSANEVKVACDNHDNTIDERR